LAGQANLFGQRSLHDASFPDRPVAEEQLVAGHL
jgi:hypothetical protein